MSSLLRALKELRRYPSAIAGLAIIGLLIIVSIYAMVTIPYSEAIRLWRGGPGVWDEYPRNAVPAWFDWFSGERLPKTITVDSRTAGTRTVEPLDGGLVRVRYTLPFEFPYAVFPSELSLFSAATYEGKRTRFTATWIQPDGHTIPLVSDRSMRDTDTYYISLDNNLRDRLPRAAAPEEGLFLAASDAAAADPRAPASGTYELVVETEIPEGHSFETRLVVFGKAYGLAGTDNRRRDIMVALLWGAPLALAFGLFGALVSNIATFVLAGVGTWVGGHVDGLFQRLTQLTLLLPLLPIMVMVGQFYGRSLWLILGIVILLNIFSGAFLTYRSMFLQAKEAPYIEAAKAYGARNGRIIFRYLLPRIVPVLLPTFVLVIPQFVFLEASLAVLGLGDPILPTWGKLIYDARSADALYKGYYYWILEPATLLMITGFGFALVGFALDRIFNPRLRTM
ncbi:MAG: ABC transporter permease [Candidatus Bipolaricaulis sp.]|nr:ABC transporter permease [Candidatus Bipolaricaulis sp.]